MSWKETSAALCSFSLPLIQFPSKISPVARGEPSVLLDVGIAWKGEGKAWTEVLEPWGGEGELELVECREATLAPTSCW